MIESEAKKIRPDDPGYCQHCGALVYADSTKCAQCGKFPIKVHRCSHCGFLSAPTAERCWKCARLFQPDGDYL